MGRYENSRVITCKSHLVSACKLPVLLTMLPYGWLIGWLATWVNCSQMPEWIEKPLGVVLGLSQSHIAFDGIKVPGIAFCICFHFFVICRAKLLKICSVTLMTFCHIAPQYNNNNDFQTTLEARCV